ncbi:MAG: hypothetical protein KGL39_19795 [Patescibacteria group bacterium]|nr:hypothetical protein [Patescibacteria group bacterium]
MNRYEFIFRAPYEAVDHCSIVVKARTKEEAEKYIGYMVDYKQFSIPEHAEVKVMEIQNA